MTILEQTPARALASIESSPTLFRTLLSGLDEESLHAREAPDKWSPFDVLGHMLHCEHEDWIPRFQRMLEYGEDKPFDAFDPDGHLEFCKGLDLEARLVQFETRRARSLEWLRAQPMDHAQLSRRGTHPTFGSVRFSEMLATWACHDRVHMAQVCRILCRQATDDVGPWRAFLPILG